jgi:chemotaxis protein methyltransferase CheR
MGMTSTIALDDYKKFKDFLENACGITLGDGKQYLIASRLTKLLQTEQMSSVSELLVAIQKGRPPYLRDQVIDAMTTNETSWFRDRNPFEVLTKEIFPQWDLDNKKHCKIWSAACSSGQEPYTISITLSEYIAMNAMTNLKSAKIMATDISTSMLQEAKRAEYDENIVGRGLSSERKQQFFIRNGERWRVADVIKQRVSFKEQNLLAPYDSLGKFDIIFCRNVLIYFAVHRKKDILNRIARSLNPGGILFLGAAETVTGYSDAFDMVRSDSGVYYRLKDQ